jgi:hypothetical protein
MMKIGHIWFFCLAILVLVSFFSGCVAPPKESPPATFSPGNQPDQYYTPAAADSSLVTVTSPGSSNVLADATPFQTPPTPTLGFTAWNTSRVETQEKVCLIYLTRIEAAEEVKKSAKVFNLKNPPMYINYTIHEPYYVTGIKQVNKKYSDQADTASFKYLNPIAYLEVTARNRTTGVIYTQDGFGKGYGQYLNKTFKITKTDDLLIEYGGYNVTAALGIWVKPSKNLDDIGLPAGAECRYPDEFPSNTL